MGVFANSFWKEKTAGRRKATVFDGRLISPNPGTPVDCCATSVDTCCKQNLLNRIPYFNQGGHLFTKRRLK